MPAIHAALSVVPMADSARIVCRLFVKTVADRRTARPVLQTLPGDATDFTHLERGVFRELDRRGARLKIG